MLTLHVEAETFAELSQKVLKEMGFMTAPLDALAAAPASGAVREALNEVLSETLPQDEAPKRTRRTRAQMEADAATAQAPSEVRAISALPLHEQQAAIDAAQATAPSGDQDAASAGSEAGQTAESTASLSEEPEGGFDYQLHVKPAVLRLSQKGGRPAVEALLKPYAVSNAQQIPAEKYPDLMAEIDRQLAA